MHMAKFISTMAGHRPSAETIWHFLSRLVITGLFLLSAAFPDVRAQTIQGTHMLTILHTNDLHGHLHGWPGWGELAGKQIGGFDRMAAAINQVRQELGKEKILLLDGGDTIGDTMIAAQTKGHAIVETMNAVGYDAMVIGNHEPDFGPEALLQRIKHAKFPVLAANLIERTTGAHVTKPYVIRQVGGIKVAILGLAYPNTALTTSPKNVAGLEFRDAVETARLFIPRLRQEGAELVVVLSHLGLSAEQNLAQNVAGIDVIVGGHSHNRMQKAAQVGNTLIVQAGAHGSDLGRLDLEVQNGKITGHRRSLILIDHNRFDADPRIASLLSTLYAPHEHVQKEQLTNAAAAIARAQTLAGEEPEPRDRESPADMLFADILREQTGADIALLPGVGYGVPLPAGAVLAKDLRSLIPHDSKVVTMTLAGRQIQEILEQSIENTYTKDHRLKVGGIIQVSGLSAYFDKNAPQGSRVQKIHVGAQPMDPERRYLVATNSLLASGGHRYQTFLQGKDRHELGDQYDVVKSSLQKKQKITNPSGNRLVPIR